MNDDMPVDDANEVREIKAGDVTVAILNIDDDGILASCVETEGVDIEYIISKENLANLKGIAREAFQGLRHFKVVNI